MARKYRHKGYMSDASDKESKKKKPKERDVFRGRSEGRYREEVFRCHECNEKIIGFSIIGPEETCPRCKTDTRCCKNCKHFNPSVRYECTQKIPKKITKKAKANECEFFSPRIVLDLMSPKSGSSADDARKAFENLFKK